MSVEQVALTFNGFPAAAFDFYERLEADNSKVFWQANRPTYLSEVKATFDALADEMSDYGPFHLFRPYNDARFAKGRPAYKTHQGMYVERDGGAGFYIQLSATGLMIGAGYHQMAADQLDRFRQAVDDEHRGAEIAAIVDATMATGFTMSAIASLKTAPRGYAKDHPRIELLRRKGLIAVKSFPVESWMHSPAAKDQIVAEWQACDALNDYLDAHVGPSELPPPDFDR